MSNLDQKPTTVLLDIGNVVLGLDFHRVFKQWALRAEVDVERFYENWDADEHYAAHEVGTLDFQGYCEKLSTRFDVRLSSADWAAGWNDLWTEPFHDVTRLLPEVKRRYRLFAFSNTNPTHEQHFRQHYADALASFDTVFTSSTLGLRKPHPEAYLAVCAEMGCAPGEVVFLDDHPLNIEGANETGLRAELCTSQAQVVNALERLL